MFHAIYIENAVKDHPRTKTILERCPRLPQIPCDRFGEIFNRKAQNFRTQKQAPALILAKKHGQLVLPTPAGYGIGDPHNYYFSHMLNCIFDCRYCFLQGMYRSAHYVLFVNFEDFQNAIEKKLNAHQNEQISFFSGYDCDSLALEPITHFMRDSLPFFSERPRATLELRTKSAQIRFLLERSPVPNIIAAFTLTPKVISDQLEHKTPSLQQRLKALKQLQNQGWNIGLRFDPVIFCDDWKSIYSQFYQEVFTQININRLHSASMGTFRLPKEIFKNMIRLYPDEKLFAHSLDETQDIVSYKKRLEEEMISFCSQEILKYIPGEIFFPCCGGESR